MTIPFAQGPVPLVAIDEIEIEPGARCRYVVARIDETLCVLRSADDQFGGATPQIAALEATRARLLRLLDLLTQPSLLRKESISVDWVKK